MTAIITDLTEKLFLSTGTNLGTIDVSLVIILLVIGLIVQNYSYTPIWIVLGLMYPLAFILLLVFIRKIQPLSLVTVKV